MTSLWSVVQQEGEPFHNYIKRYISACTDVKDMNDNFVVHAFTAGLTNEHVRYAIIHEDVSTMHKLVAHAQKFAEAD